MTLISLSTQPVLLFLCTQPVLLSLSLHSLNSRLQALVYVLPSTTAVFSYTIGSRKLSANEQFFFVRAQTVVSLLQNNSHYIRRLFYN